jgi:hypothetical protein
MNVVRLKEDRDLMGYRHLVPGGTQSQRMARDPSLALTR